MAAWNSRVSLQDTTGQYVDMKQNAEKPPSPPQFNSSSSAMFPGMDPATLASLSLLTPQQLLAASRTAALMAAGIPLHATLAATPSLYCPHQNLFTNWVPPAASSPPPNLHLSTGPVSPALSTKSFSRHNNSNSGNINNNNNVVSSSADRVSKKNQGTKRKISKSRTDTTQNSLEASAPLSPPSSVSPETGKDNKDKVFTCAVCSRSFGYKHVLQNHERTHTGEKPFECQQCKKRFTRDHHLKTHMRLHTGEKPYHCSHCDRQFVQVANLRRHLRVHTGERPYACELCSAKFSDSNQLKAHLLIHKGEKPFECEHCQMKFRRRHHLIHHKCGMNSNNVPQMQQSQVDSPSIASDDLEEDIDIDVDADAEESENATAHNTARKIITPIKRPTHRHLPSPVANNPMPLNLSNVPAGLPEQTEPEDLSMSTGTHRVHSLPHSHSSGDSPMSRSPSTDTVHEEDDEELNVSEASPSTLFLRKVDSSPQKSAIRQPSPRQSNHS